MTENNKSCSQIARKTKHFRTRLLNIGRNDGVPRSSLLNRRNIEACDRKTALLQLLLQSCGVQLINFVIICLAHTSDTSNSMICRQNIDICLKHLEKTFYASINFKVKDNFAQEVFDD